jgi:hypothetical protein
VTPQFAKVWAFKINGGGVLEGGFAQVVSHVSVTDLGGERGITGRLERSVVWRGEKLNQIRGVVDDYLLSVDGSVVNICGTITEVQEEGRWAGPQHVGQRFGMAIQDVPGGPDWDRFPPPKNGPSSIDCETFVPEAKWNEMVKGDYRFSPGG